ncbi:hypothetical protein ES288_A06G228600v1 [Gossypium darwinii]|uniref:Uncharacterized protein n=1 Tax=Gossypium darwinii TaxID=34276 RepID=A0A5D2G8Q5_GOSDA|nr:hypothetical protein ES288_A06G228600v1 [Gossypium darwinii]
MVSVITNCGSRVVLVLAIMTTKLATSIEAVKFKCILKCNFWKCALVLGDEKLPCVFSCYDRCGHKVPPKPSPF